MYNSENENLFNTQLQNNTYFFDKTHETILNILHILIHLIIMEHL